MLPQNSSLRGWKRVKFMKFSVELYQNYKYYDIQIYYVTVYSSLRFIQCVFCV
jgi:hypothetical protein